MSLTALMFLIAYLGGLLAAFVWRPIYGLYTYVAVFYLHPPSRWWGADLPDMRWSFLAAVVTLIAMWIKGSSSTQVISSWSQSTIAKCLIAYTCWMWIQAPWVISPYHVDGAILFTKYVLLFYLIVKLVQKKADFESFCLSHVFGCTFLSWLVFIAPDTGRLESVGGPGIDNANTLGMHLATGLFFAAFLLLTIKDKRKFILLAALPFILNAIIQTETRGAIVGIILGGILTVYLKPKAIRRSFYLYALLAVFAVLFVANEAFLSRMETLRAGVDEQSEWDSSAQSRIAIAKAQGEMFLDYPFGAGHQGTATLSTQYIEERWLARQTGDRASHNTVLSVLVDQGIPGILIFTVLFFSVLRSLRQIKRLDKVGLPVDIGVYRAMLGGTLVVIFGSGMFAQYLKAEVQIWTLALLAFLFEYCSREGILGEEGKTADNHGVRKV